MFYKLMFGLLALMLITGSVLADTTITYQGRLDSGGQPHDGTVDMLFRLYANPTGGSPLATEPGDGVQITSGQFQVELDFGEQPYEDGLWLEITVNGQLLSPRQRITGAPLSQRALSAVSAPPAGPAGGDLAGTFPNPEIADGAVGPAAIANAAVSASALAEAAVRANSLGTIFQVQSAREELPEGVHVQASVECPEGTVLLSGGGGLAAPFSQHVDAAVLESLRHPSVPNRWLVRMRNNSSDVAGVRAYAYCLEQ